MKAKKKVKRPGSKYIRAENLRKVQFSAHSAKRFPRNYLLIKCYIEQDSDEPEVHDRG
jgi:hypothetical protein